MSTSYGFWSFSNRVYQRDGVQAACLELQNEYGLDVNMLLYCCWFGGTYGEFSEEVFERSLTTALNWSQNVVQPLRTVRTWLKLEILGGRVTENKSIDDFREEVKATELAAEKFQQNELERLVDNQSDNNFESLSASSANLKRYFNSCGVDITEDSRRLLAVILAASIPGEGLHKALRSLG